MPKNNPRFQAHLPFTHERWKQIVQIGDTVIDATCGNGHDTLFLAQLALDEAQGHVIAYDIQEAAIQQTKQLLNKNLKADVLNRIHLVLGSHATLTSDIPNQSVRLIVYNLGYLPKGDKQLTTTTKSTLESVADAQRLVMIGGLISITCYPGHPEGEIEEKALLEYVKSLDPRIW